MNNFICCKCGKKHKGNSRNYPIARMGIIQVVDDPGGRILDINKETGQPTISQKTYKPKKVITGYVCRWCVRKQYLKENPDATKQFSYQSAGKAIPSEGQRRQDNGNTRTDVRKSSKDNFWGRARSFLSGIRGKVLQNNDQSRISPKQPNAG